MAICPRCWRCMGSIRSVYFYFCFKYSPYRKVFKITILNTYQIYIFLRHPIFSHLFFFLSFFLSPFFFQHGHLLRSRYAWVKQRRECNLTTLVAQMISRTVVQTVVIVWSPPSPVRTCRVPRQRSNTEQLQFCGGYRN